MSALPQTLGRPTQPTHPIKTVWAHTPAQAHSSERMHTKCELRHKDIEIRKAISGDWQLLTAHLQGVGCVSTPPYPSRPSLLLPQLHASPALVATSMWCLPAATLTTWYACGHGVGIVYACSNSTLNMHKYDDDAQWLQCGCKEAAGHLGYLLHNAAC